MISISKKVNSRDILNSKIKIGQTISEGEVYQHVQKIHRDYDDFIDGDIGDRIEEHSRYKVVEVNLSDLDLDEWQIDECLIEEFSALETIPPP